MRKTFAYFRFVVLPRHFWRRAILSKFQIWEDLNCQIVIKILSFFSPLWPPNSLPRRNEICKVDIRFIFRPKWTSATFPYIRTLTKAFQNMWTFEHFTGSIFPMLSKTLPTVFSFQPLFNGFSYFYCKFGWCLYERISATSPFPLWSSSKNSSVLCNGFPWYWNEIALNIRLDILQDFKSRSISYFPYHEFVFDF